MNNKYIALLLSLTITLASCASSNTNDKKATEASQASSAVTENIDSDDEIALAYLDYDEKYQYYKESYPDKTILTWLCDDYVTYEQEVNSYLVENDYDYVICFKVLSYSETVSDTQTYISAVTELAENEDNTDIIGSFGLVLDSDVYSSFYYYLAENDLLEPLDEYLKQEEYTQFYDLMPQKYWDSYRYNGYIYGIDNSFSSLYSNNSLIISADTLEKSGLAAEDFNKTLSELGEVYKELNEKIGGKASYSDYFWTNNIFTANYITNGVGVAIDNQKAVNVFEQDEISEYYNTLNEYAQEGFLEINEESENTAAIKNSRNDLDVGEVIYNTNRGTVEIANEENNYICNPSSAIGVNSNSSNKELSVDAILNVIFNDEINNIITYGVEGTQYEICDGTVVMNINEQTDAEYSVDVKLNNPLISMPCYYNDGEIINYDYPSAYENAQYLDGFGFLFDASEIKDTYLSVVNKISEFNPTSDDIDSYLVEFNQELYDAGMQDVLDEINRQCEEWSEKS
ncbi:MAG: extracellular solute-binding protein [Ruminococcus sp.]|nr:extracellular solute-binding protein [Ruminococcus sp.]